MARDLDNFPTYDAVTDNDGHFTGIWFDFMATFIESLKEYLSQFGMFAPRVTTEQRDSLRNVVGGQYIYNTTLEKFQGYEAGAWVNFI